MLTHGYIEHLASSGLVMIEQHAASMVDATCLDMLVQSNLDKKENPTQNVKKANSRNLQASFGLLRAPPSTEG